MKSAFPLKDPVGPPNTTISINFRYLEMSTIGGRGGCFFNIFNSGVVQSVIVFLCATAFNLPRWYEYELKYR